MKAIYEKFTDKEMKILLRNKNGHSWHDYILLMAEHCNEAIRKGDLKIYKV